MTVQIQGSEFDSKVLASAEPVLIDFFATWCGPCRMMAPTVEEISNEIAGKAHVYKLDVDEAPQIAQRYGIMSVPTFMVFKDGQPVAQRIGAQPKESLLAMFE